MNTGNIGITFLCELFLGIDYAVMYGLKNVCWLSCSKWSLSANKTNTGYIEKQTFSGINCTVILFSSSKMAVGSPVQIY